MSSVADPLLPRGNDLEAVGQPGATVDVGTIGADIADGARTRRQTEAVALSSLGNVRPHEPHGITTSWRDAPGPSGLGATIQADGPGLRVQSNRRRAQRAQGEQRDSRATRTASKD